LLEHGAKGDDSAPSGEIYSSLPDPSAPDFMVVAGAGQPFAPLSNVNELTL
jgi:hypothetical protein